MTRRETSSHAFISCVARGFPASRRLGSLNLRRVDQSHRIADGCRMQVSGNSIVGLGLDLGELSYNPVDRGRDTFPNRKAGAGSPSVEVDRRFLSPQFPAERPSATHARARSYARAFQGSLDPRPRGAEADARYG